MQAMNSETQPPVAPDGSSNTLCVGSLNQRMRSSVATCTAQESKTPQPPMPQSRIARRRGVSAPPRFIMPSPAIENDEDRTLEGNQKIDDILDSGLKHLQETMHRIGSDPSLQFQQEFDKSLDRSDSSSVFV